MADTNTYIKQQNVKKYTTQNKFNSLDRTDIPVGTEYNIVGSIEESDLSANLVSKVNTIDGKTGGSITGNLTIGGNLVVNGETTTVSSTTLSVKDKLIEVGAGNTVALTTPAGIFTPKYDGTNSGGLVYDNTGTAYVGDITLDSNGNVDVSNSELQPIATRDSKENFTDGNLVKWDSANERLIDGGSISSNLSNGSGISISSSSGKAVITNSGVRSISTGSANGTISVNTNGTSANVAVKGLGSAAYTESSAYAKLANDNTFTGTNTFNKDVVIKAPHRDTYYASNLCRHFSANTPTEFVIKTKIRFVDSTHMPVVRIYGYAYGLNCPIELRIGFYIYGGNLGWAGVSCTGAWKPEVYLFKYTENDVDWVAIGFKGACYYCGFQVDAQIGAMGSFGDYFQIDGWTTTHNGADTSVSLIPAVRTDKCVQVSYKPMQTDIGGNALTATKATQDSDGNVIKDTYVKLTGDQTVGGVKTFSDGILLPGLSDSAYNTNGIVFSGGAKISANSSTGSLGIYGKAIYLRPNSLAEMSTNGIVLNSNDLSPTTTKNCSLGTSSLYWNNIYGTTIYQNGNKVLDASSKGAASGLAELDSTGKVPSSQLPSYVDDVLEYSAKSSFPTTGETGKIYVDTATNLTYRWSGSAYVEISPSLALGETSSTAYRGDRGKIAYDHSQTAHAPSNAEKNQNAFSNVVVGSTTIAADSATDTLTLVGGTNVTLTPDATNDKVTIEASDTKVTQTAVAASSYTYWRPLVFGASGSSTEGFTPSTVTDGVLTTSTISCQPSSSTIRATTFKGNASTATKLQKAITIALGTGATGTATSFDGSANITIPVTSVKEAYLSWGGQHINGGVTPVGAALSAEHSANRLAYLNPNAISAEYSDDGGSTWSAYSLSNDVKTGLVTTSGNVAVGHASTVTVNHRTRITLTAQNGTTGYVYTRPRKLLINVSSPHGLRVTIECKTGASGAAWNTVGTYAVSGWSGWNDIPLDMSTFGGSTSQTYNYWYLRLTFANTSVSSSYSTTKSRILGLRMFGDTSWTSTSNMGATGHLYAYDISQNATFPAEVTARSFNGNLYGKLISSSSRITSADIIEPTSSGRVNMRLDIVSSSMTTNKPVSDGYLSTYTWDIDSFNTQLYLPNNFNDASTRPQIRCYNANSSQWTGWKSFALLDDITALSSVYAAKSHTHSVTAKGTVSQPTFTGTAHNHTFTGTSVNSGKPDTTNVTTIYSITDVGSLPSHTYTAPSLEGTVDKQCLTLTFRAGSHSFSAGSLPTRSSAISMPNTNHTHAVTAAGTIGNTTAGGTVSQPTFEGIAVTSGSGS